MAKNLNPNEQKSWLNKLMLNSWEIEMLFSGFAVFGLFELRKYLVRYLYLHTGREINIYTNSSITELLSNIFVILPGLLKTSIEIFIINLLFYLFFRGLWIGAVGLRYVSGEIEYDKLNFSPRFLRFFKTSTGTYDNFILRLEKISSIIFALTFLMIFVFFSFGLYFFLVFLALIAVSKFSVLLASVLSVFFLLVLIVSIVDFFTLSFLKKIKHPVFSKGYYWLYRITSYVTLSRFWRPMLLNFLEEKFARRAILLIIPYALILVFFSDSKRNLYSYFPSDYIEKESIHSKMFVPRYYDNLNEKYNSSLKEEWNDRIVYFSIPEHKVKGSLFEIFITHDQCFDEVLRTKQEDVFFNIKGADMFSNHVLEDSLALDLLDTIKNQLFQTKVLSIDNKPVPKDGMECDLYIHPLTNQAGYLCFFPLNSLDVGRHLLQLKQYCISDTSAVEVPFVYLGK